MYQTVYTGGVKKNVDTLKNHPVDQGLALKSMVTWRSAHLEKDPYIIINHH